MKFLALLALAALPVLAVPTGISSAEIATNVAKGLRLLSIEEGKEPVWKTQAQALDLLRQKINYVSGTG